MKTGNVSIVIDPRRTELARYATYHLPLRPGTNVAVLNMMMYYIISEGLADEKFIAERTEGFEDYENDLLLFRRQKEKEWEKINLKRLHERAAKLGIPNNLLLMKYIDGLEFRISKLENRN